MITFLATPWISAFCKHCRLCIVLVLFLLGTVPALSAELEMRRSYLEDPGGTKSLADVQHELLTPFEGDLSKGYSKSTFWIRIDIANAPPDEPLVLTVSPNYLEDVALLGSDSAAQPLSKGMAQWSSQGHPPFLEHAFLIPEGPEQQTFWLRVSSHTSVIVDMDVAPLSAALVAETRRNFLSAFYIGCLAILIMVGFAVAYISDDLTARVFPVYETVVLIFSLNLFGYLGFLIGPHLSTDALSLIHQLATVATTLAAGIFHSLFLRSVGARRSWLALALALIVVNAGEFVLIALGSVRLALHVNAYIALAYPIIFFGMALTLPKARASDFPKPVVLLYYTLFLLIIGPMAAQLLGFRPPFHYVFYGNVLHGLMSGALMLVMLVWRTLRIWERERKSGENLALAIDSAQLGIWTFDPKESNFSLSETCRLHFGFPRDRDTVSEQDLLSAVHPDDRMTIEASSKSAVADGKDFSVEHRVIWPDGSVHWLYGRGRPYFSADKRLLRIDGVTINISENKFTEEANRTNASIIKATFDSLAEALVVGDANGNVKLLNNEAAAFFRFESLDQVPRHFEAFRSVVQLEEIDGGVLSADEHPFFVALTGVRKAYGLKLTRTDINKSWYALVHTAPILNDGGAVVGAATAWLEISELIQLQRNLEGMVQEKTEELKAANRILSEMTRRDALTGLYNRLACDERLAAEFEHARRTGDYYCILMIDIDLFKRVNDKYGHAIGDEVLKMVSGTLSRNLRKCDFTSRWGGEEFLVLLPSTDIEHACVVANKLRRALDSEEHPTAGKVQISVGVSMASPHDVDQNVSVMRADAALYEAKRTGRNRVVARTELAGMPAAAPRET